MGQDKVEKEKLCRDRDRTSSRRKERGRSVEVSSPRVFFRNRSGSGSHFRRNRRNGSGERERDRRAVPSDICVMSNQSPRRSHRLNRDMPEPNKCLGVFGLNLRTTEKDLRGIFSRFGSIEKCTLVLNGQTGRSRGFSFISFESLRDAKAAKEACNGMEIEGSRVRVDFSITQRAHTPTPGVYMGKSRYNHRDYRIRSGGSRDRRGPGNFYRSGHRRSVSPHPPRRRPRHSQSRSRSRSRSRRNYH